MGAKRAWGGLPSASRGPVLKELGPEGPPLHPTTAWLAVGQAEDEARAKAYGWRMGLRAGSAVVLGLASGAIAAWLGVQMALHEPMDEGNRHSLALPLAIARRGGPQVLAEVRRAVEAEEPYAGEGVALLDAQGKLLAMRGVGPDWPAQMPEGASNLGTWRVLCVPLPGVGELRAVHLRASVDRALNWTALALALAVPLGLIFALALARRVARTAAKPYAEALARERRVVRDLGHELRTPLAVIRAHAELALKRKPEEGTRSALTTIVSQSQSLADFAEQLLALTRLDAGQAGPSQRVALGELVESLVEDLAPLAEAQGLRFETSGLESMAWVQVESSMLLRAVSNLLDNALRHAGAPGKVSVGLVREEAFVQLRVANGGPQIPAEAFARLGERFFRPEASRLAHPGGSGLGLAFVVEVARSAGGSLRLKPGPDGGLEALLSLPAA